MAKAKKMNEVSLKIGKQKINLRKSEKLIGVKAKAGMDQKVLASFSTSTAGPISGKKQNKLGGFHIIKVEDKPMEETLDAIRESAVVASGTHVFHTSDDEVPFVPTGQIYIEFKKGTSDDDIQKALDQHKLMIVEARDERELICQVTPGSSNPIKIAAALQESPQVEVAEPDLATPGEIKALTIPGDTLLNRQWHLRNFGTSIHRGTSVGMKKGADARVVAAWERGQTLGSPTVVVAVIDDGFDLSHPDISGPTKIVAPQDFTRNNANPVPDPLNGDWHGTACAGVAIGNADGKGIVGAAPHARLMPVRWGINLSDGQIERWFSYVRDQGAWVVSCSWGAQASNFPLSTRASKAITRCAKEGRNGLGCVICFAAGNEASDINDPNNDTVNGFANHPNVIAVAACNSRDRQSDYSNFGKAISVCAPSSGAGGWSITTCDVIGDYMIGEERHEAGYSTGPFTDDFGGTSSATPLVAGICALLLTIKPSLKAAQVKDLIQKTARKVGGASSYGPNGHSPKFGYGCIDAERAVKELMPN